MLRLQSPTSCWSNSTGKTLLAQTLLVFLRFRLLLLTPTTLTEAGYVGEKMSKISCFKLITAADGDVEPARVSIVCIDEIDKIAHQGREISITRDVSGEGCSAGIQKILEGYRLQVFLQQEA